MNIFYLHFLFLRFWRRNVNALEMGGRTRPQRMRRRRKMKHKKHLDHREKGLVLFHNSMTKSMFMNFPSYKEFGVVKIFFTFYIIF